MNGRRGTCDSFWTSFPVPSSKQEGCLALTMWPTSHDPGISLKDRPIVELKMCFLPSAILKLYFYLNLEGPRKHWSVCQWASEGSLHSQRCAAYSWGKEKKWYSHFELPGEPQASLCHSAFFSCLGRVLAGIHSSINALESALPFYN